MKKFKRILSIFCLAAILTSGAATASAATPTKLPEVPVTIAANPGIAVPYSDVIETIIRATDDGRIQYRRWNATRGYWVDPYWIDLP